MGPPERDPTAESSLLTGLRLGGRYTLHEPIGRGSAGQVYRATQHPLEREVAVKILRSDLPPGPREVFGQRFLREAALAGKLQHPNIVTVHDFGEQDEILYVVMELLQGRTLASATKDHPLPPEDAARFVSAVARALRHAHAAGLVHRDVKPGNIMLVQDDDGVEQPKLMDFGLVRATDEDLGLTVAGQYMGTPAFMSPEQARTPLVDHRSDIYALGVTLYRTLTGRLPFEAEDALSMALQHQTDAVPAMSTKGASVPPALEAIARRAMEKRPEARYSDAGKMADALDAWLGGLEREDLRRDNLRGDPPQRSRGPWIAALGLIGTAGVAALGLLLVAVGGAGIFIGWWSTRSKPEPIVIFEPPAPGLAVPLAPEPEPQPEPAPEPPKPAARPQKPRSEAPPKPPPRPDPAPAPDPAPRPDPAPAPVPELPPGSVAVDGVVFDKAHAERALSFINTAAPDALANAGVYERGVGIILQRRPFPSMAAFGEASGIGLKTVQAVADATR